MHRFIRISIQLIFGMLFLYLQPILAAPAGLQTREVSSAIDDTYASRRWIALYNRTDTTLNEYPLEITSMAGAGFDHAELVAAGKAQADGDDLRVEIDGSEVDRWLVEPDTTQTKVWINLSLQPRLAATLDAGYASNDLLTSLTVVDTTGFPVSGLLINPSNGEAFTYTSLDTTHFLGVNRAARRTFLGAGTVGDDLVWVEHETYLLYGNNSLGAPARNDHREPAFDITTSSNASWNYLVFGETDGLRSAAWVSATLAGSPVLYTGYHAGFSDPWATIGVEVNASERGIWQVYNPCGITHAVVAGEARRTGSAWTITGIKSSVDGTTWSTFYSLDTPLTTNWFAWSADRDTVTDARYLRLNFQGPPVSVTNDMDLSGATLTLNTTDTPGVLLTPECTPTFLPLLLRP